MALVLRNSNKIDSVKINLQSIKFYQWAHDLTLFLSITESVPSAIAIIDELYRNAGLNLNKSKTVLAASKTIEFPETNTLVLNGHPNLSKH